MRHRSNLAFEGFCANEARVAVNPIVGRNVGLEPDDLFRECTGQNRALPGLYVAAGLTPRARPQCIYDESSPTPSELAIPS